MPRGRRAVKRLAASLLVVTALAWHGPAFPQTAPTGRPVAPPATPPAASSTKPAPAPPAADLPAPDAPPPAYERDLMRLSEVMGTLSFLTDLCREAGSAEWRDRMSALIQSEAATQARRDRLAGSYNKGYRSFALTYRTCTDSARAAVGIYIAEGARLSRIIANRYGG